MKSKKVKSVRYNSVNTKVSEEERREHTLCSPWMSTCWSRWIFCVSHGGTTPKQAHPKGLQPMERTLASERKWGGTISREELL